MKTLPVICVTCPDCKGLGFIEDKLCAGCDGAMQLVIPDKPSKSALRTFATNVVLAALVATLVAIAIAAL